MFFRFADDISPTGNKTCLWFIYLHDRCFRRYSLFSSPFYEGIMSLRWGYYVRMGERNSTKAHFVENSTIASSACRCQTGNLRYQFQRRLYPSPHPILFQPTFGFVSVDLLPFFCLLKGETREQKSGRFAEYQKQQSYVSGWATAQGRWVGTAKDNDK